MTKQGKHICFDCVYWHPEWCNTELALKTIEMVEISKNNKK